MNTGGWIFMIVSLVVVWGTTIWAYRRLLSSPKEETPTQTPTTASQEK